MAGEAVPARVHVHVVSLGAEVAPVCPLGAGSPSRSLSTSAIREQAAPSSMTEPVLPGGRASSAYNDLPDLQQNDMEGTLKLGVYPVAGRLSHFLQEWREITTNQWVLQIISQGYALPFLSLPPCSAGPVETPSCFFSQARGAVDRSPVPPGQGSRRGAYSGRGRSGILFTLLPGHQKDRRLSPNPKSKRIESLSPRGKIQDGDAGFHSSRSSKRHVDV